MSSATRPPEPSDLAEAHRLALALLREMGMEIAGRLHAQSREPDADLGEVATRFARVARAVRHTIALEAKLAELARQRLRQADSDGAGLGARHALHVANTALQRAEARQREAENRLEVTTLVRRAIRKAPGLDVAALDTRLDERLDDERDDSAFRADADLAQTIAAICADLGLAPDWGGFSALDWSQVSRELRAQLTGEAIETLPPARWQRRPPRTLPPRTLPARGRHRPPASPAPATGAELTPSSGHNPPDP